MEHDKETTDYLKRRLSNQSHAYTKFRHERQHDRIDIERILRQEIKSILMEFVEKEIKPNLHEYIRDALREILMPKRRTTRDLDAA